MSGRSSILFVVLFLTASFAPGQTTSQPSQLELGKAAMEAHDPTSAITHFERAESREGRAWLAVALMMESRSPSDPFVERAYDAAARARAERPEDLPSRAELAAALRPGEMVVTFLFVEQHAYAWAFDRDTLLGYPLPRPSEIGTAIERFNAYRTGRDNAGVERAANELVPALFGPIVARHPEPARLVVVPDEPIRQLHYADLIEAFGMDADISSTNDAGLLEELRRRPAPGRPAWLISTLIGAAVTGAALFAISRLTTRRSRERS